MSECRHTGQTTLDIDLFCSTSKRVVLTCLECGDLVPKGHHRKMWEESGLKTTAPTGNTFGFHTDHSGYQVDGGYHNCGADQT